MPIPTISTGDVITATYLNSIKSTVDSQATRVFASSPTSDTYIDQQNPTTNFGSSVDLAVGETWLSAGWGRHALMTFDISHLSGKVIGSAVLSLFRVDVNAVAGATFVINTLRARRVMRSYNPTQVTWNQWQTGSNWTTAGARGLGTDVVGDFYGESTLVTDSQYAEFQLDLTHLIQEEQFDGKTVSRIILGWSRQTSGQNAANFASVENANQKYRPQMFYVYG